MNLSSTIRSFHHEGFSHFLIVAVFSIDIIQQLNERLTNRLRVGGDLCEHEGGTIRILIADGVGAEIAVTFFPTENEKTGVFEP